jgi:hypothetical protein
MPAAAGRAGHLDALQARRTLEHGMDSTPPTTDRQRCIDACNACADACDRCAAACLREKDVQQMARCISLDMDCAAACRFAAGAMARDSELTNTVCAMCAMVCHACAAQCETHDAAHCVACAKACRDCAAACDRMGLAAVQAARPPAS